MSEKSRSNVAECEPVAAVLKSRSPSGVSFRGLNCYGFITENQCQLTFLTGLLWLPRSLVRLASKGRHSEKVIILHQMTGLVQPGEMLLVLGRPGSGCSTFLKCLSGNTYGTELEDDSINYGGVSYQQMTQLQKGERVYVAEQDAHFSELTLGQTLAFTTGLRDVSSVLEYHGLADSTNSPSWTIASLFHLEKAFDTRVGNAMVRGISGGEKRRASLAEAYISSAQYQCWDNSTRGLDSSTALSFISLLRLITNKARLVMMMSIYQASEAQYQKFEKVMLLYEGRQIYFGPTAMAAKYFEDLGFQRPNNSTTADFLTSLTNSAERMTRDSVDHVPKTPDEFAAAWRQSQQYRLVSREIREFESENAIQKEDSSAVDYYTSMTSTGRQLTACFRRGLQRLRNNYVPVVAGLVANSILALIIGSAFYNLPQTAESMDDRAVLLFFSLVINACTPAFEVLTMWAQRPIVEKHARYAYCQPFIESVTSMLCDLPNKIGTSFLFNITLYFMTNLRRTGSAFFTYYLFNLFVLLAMSMYFRMVGSVSRRMEQTMAPSSIAVLLCSVYAGFVIPVAYMVPWLGWFRFINPLAYVYESLMLNEFLGRKFNCLSPLPNGPSYSSNAVMEGKVCPIIGALPGESVVEGSRYLAQKYQYYPSHLWRNLAIEFGLMVAFCVIHVLASQYILAERSKGDVLVFQSRPQALQQPSSSGPEDGRMNAPLTFAQDVNRLRSHQFETFDQMTGLTIQKQSVVFQWNNLCYDVATKHGTKRILNEVTGWVKPGTMTALMGVSGAGKTTLLDVLAKRATFGKESGEILVGGVPRDSSFQRKVGYVQQEDLHSPAATVRETLELNALLRQAGPQSEQEKLTYVSTVLSLLEMESYADAVVGIPEAGLNIEQRKRLSIGVELVAKPELLLFLDEPTSGLDSQTAWSICVLLRKLADHGQAILCTIHQPSAQIFEMFDRLLLLSCQGQTLYFGDIGQHATSVIEYFEGKGVPRFPGASANPAEWMLEVTNGDDFEQVSAKCINSAQRQPSASQPFEPISEKNVDAVESSGIPRLENKFAASLPRQLFLITKQVCIEYWRDPTYMLSKMALCTGLALFNGLSFTNTPLDLQGVTNIVFSIFLLSMLFSTVDQQVIPRLLDNRSRYESRDSRSKSYSWTVFLSANILVELFWQTVAAILVFIVWYFPTGLWRNSDPDFTSSERGALSFVLIWLFCLWISAFSQAIAAGMEQAETAVQIATLFFWLSLVFSGVIVKPDALPGFWIFVYRVSPLTYFIRGLVAAGLANTHIHCSAIETFLVKIPVDQSRISSSLTCASYFAPYVEYAGGYLDNPEATNDCRYCPIFSTNTALKSLGMDIGHPWWNAGYMTVHVIFNILAVFALYWLARRPKGNA